MFCCFQKGKEDVTGVSMELFTGKNILAMHDKIDF